VKDPSEENRELIEEIAALKQRIKKLEEAKSDRKQIEEALRKSEEKYRNIFENAVEGIFQTTPEGSFIVANPALAHMFGYDSPEEIIEKLTDFSRAMYANPKDRARVITVLNKNIAVRGFEIEFIHRNGHNIWISLNADAVRDNTGKILYYEGTMIDITRRKRMEQTLIKREKELEIKSSNLGEMNTTLKVLLKQREADKAQLESTILNNVKEFVFPYITKLRTGTLSENQLVCVDMLESNLNEIISPFLQKLTLSDAHLTPAEIQVVNLIKNGKTSKEIAEFLHVSKHTIDTHRNNIRNKLRIDKKKVNLRSYLDNLNK